MATKYIVNNVSGQTINGELLQPYKVYTALLTQTGGDDPQTISAGTLVVGVTYEITNYQSDDDFTNVGAPLNETGVKFVSTGTSPNVWTNNSELSYNNGAPEVTVLENTIGNIWFSYSDVGQYLLNFNETFSVNKIYCQGHYLSEDGGNFRVTSLSPSDNTSVLITTTVPVDFFIGNDILNNTPIEIRVYN
jgi:hypothetical protein